MLCVRSLQVPSMDPLPNSAKPLGRIASYIIMAVEFTPLSSLSRPSNGDGETSKRKAFTEINRGSLTGPIGTRLPMAKSEEPGDPGQGKLPEGLADPLKMPATSPSSTPGRAGSPWARRLTIAGLFLLVLLLAISLAWVWVRHLLRASLPRLSGTIQVSGPLGKIQIDRDALGIPTIRTEYHDDIAF